jgi:hypothetical protein
MKALVGFFPAIASTWRRAIGIIILVTLLAGASLAPFWQSHRIPSPIVMTKEILETGGPNEYFSQGVANTGQVSASMYSQPIPCGLYPWTYRAAYSRHKFRGQWPSEYSTGEISGRVVDPAGRPVSGVPITYLTSSGTDIKRNGGKSGNDGRFTIRNLPTEFTYLLCFGGHSSLSCALSGASPAEYAETVVPQQAEAPGFLDFELSLKPGQNLSLGNITVYPKMLIMSGEIVSTSRAVLSRVFEISFFGAHTSEHLHLESARRFSDVRVADEPLSVCVYGEQAAASGTSLGSRTLLARMSVPAGKCFIRVALPANSQVMLQ